MRTNAIATGIALLILLYTTGHASPGSAEEVEEIVVTATRIETPVTRVGSSVTVIAGEDLAKTGKHLLHEALRSVPGIDVIQRGGSGQQTSVFIRGANSEHTLVLIDGVEANDPISPNRAFDFANVTTENIERVEVIRGPQSTLYGSDAIGGVINIITKKGTGKPALSGSFEYGSFDTSRVTAAFRGGPGPASYALSVSRLDTEGISAASEREGNTERDGYENITVSSRVGIDLREILALELTGRYTEADAELDAFDGDDPNRVQDTKQLFLRGQVTTPMPGYDGENIIGIELSRTDRENDDAVDLSHPFDRSTSSFHGRIVRANWQGNVRFSNADVLTFGIEVQEEKGKSSFFSESAFGPFSSLFDEKAARSEGYYVQDQINIRDVIFVMAGARLDHHSRFGSELTYRIGAACLPGGGNTRLKGTIGTGFKAPSIFQIFDPASGNPDLEPEKSEGFDVGIEQEFAGRKIKGGVTYFKNRFKNLIEFTITNPLTFEGELNNIGRSTSEGVEVFSSLSLVEPLTMSVNYTYNESKDENSGEWLLRRARNRVDLSVSYDDAGGMQVHATVVYTGKRRDIFTDPATFVTERVTLGGYTTVNVSATYSLRDDKTLFLRVDNLLDKEYEEAKGFSTPGISAYLGMRVAM